MSAVYDSTFTSGQPFDAPAIGDAGLWTSRPSGHWSASGSVLTGTASGGSLAFLCRPPAEPLPVGTYGRAHDILDSPWGSSQSIIAVTPDGGWGSSAAAWGIATHWTAPGSDPAAASFYLVELRSSGVPDRPGTLTISRVEAGTTTSLGSVAWANNSAHAYDLVVESICIAPGPVEVMACVVDRATPTPNVNDPDVATGPSGLVTTLWVRDAYPGLSAGLIGPPALVALPGTDGATFSRVRLHNPAPGRAFDGFGPRPIGYGWYVGDDGTILATVKGIVFPL